MGAAPINESIFDKEKYRISKFGELIDAVKGSNHLQTFFNEGP